MISTSGKGGLDAERIGPRRTLVTVHRSKLGSRMNCGRYKFASGIVTIRK